jgi:hypothetical protein
MPGSKRSYGKARSGRVLTEEVVEQIASEAEAGLDVSKLRRRPGRPAMGSGPAEGLPIRFEPELRQALEQRAKADGVSAGEVVRRALRKYLKAG